MLDTREDEYGNPYDPPYDDWSPGGPGPWQPDYPTPPGEGGVPLTPRPNELPDPVPPPPPPPGPGPAPAPAPTGGGGGGGGGGTYNTPANFTISDSWPMFHAPATPQITPFANTRGDFAYNPFAEPAPFSYDSFNAPSLQDAQNEPGYEFARSEGQRALMNSRLATRRSGGTLKDLIGWNNKFAEQNYGNVYNRAANTYGINRGNAFENFETNRNNSFQSHQANELGRLGAYTTNFSADKDVYDRNTQAQWDSFDRTFRSALAEFDPRFDAAKLTFADIYNRDRDKLNSLTSIATAGAGG